MNLNYVTFENDNNHEYAVFYKLTGYTVNNETVSGDIKYLSHTVILMHLNTFEQK